MSMSVVERKKTAEHWQTACRKYDLNLMLQIGGASIADVLDLVRLPKQKKLYHIFTKYFRLNTRKNFKLILFCVYQNCTSSQLQLKT